MTQKTSIKIVAIVVACAFIALTPKASAEPKPRFLYSQKPLVMTADSVRDANGLFSLAMLPSPQPKCRVRLRGDVTPLT